MRIAKNDATNVIPSMAARNLYGARVLKKKERGVVKKNL
jgi:hypothetical protein